MSTTIVDMPKVAQMFDAGWKVEIWKNEIGSYTAEAVHQRPFIVSRVKKKLIDAAPEKMRNLVELDLAEPDDGLMTDDFTPEQALTRLAYKVHGEII